MTNPANYLPDMAQAILIEGASVAIGAMLSADEEKAILFAAQSFIDNDGDCPDLAHWLARIAADEAAGERAYEYEVHHGRDIPDWLAERFYDDAVAEAEARIAGRVAL